VLASLGLEQTFLQSIDRTFEDQKVKVVAFGIFSDDVITNSKFDNFFDNLLGKYISRSGV